MPRRLLIVLVILNYSILYKPTVYVLLIIRVLYNMYTNSDMQVRWKSELSNVFTLMNVVKQGGCLSPMLFTLYLDGLIQKLKQSGIGCHIGRTYCGVFGYADDLAIVSPTLLGLRQMIEICEEYASEMDLLFNPKKSKLLCYNMLLDVKPVVYLCDAIVDVVHSEMYLGNKLYNNIYKTKIDELVCDFIHTFSMCDSFTLKHIFSTYCESFNGCKIFNFTKPYNIMSKLYISWRKIIRYIFRLSPRIHNYIVSNLGNCIIGRFNIYNLLHCENITVQQIVKCKLLSPTSIFADNYRYLCNKYNIAHSD